MIRLIRVVVGPGTAVPVGADEDAVSEFWTITGDDVRGSEHGAVVAFEQGLLGGDTHAIGLELLHDPCATVVVGLAVHGARAKVALGLAEGVGTVCTEGRAYGLGRDGVVVRRRLLAEAAGG